MGRSEEGVTARVVYIHNYVYTSLDLQWELLSLHCGDCLLVHGLSSAHTCLYHLPRPPTSAAPPRFV